MTIKMTTDKRHYILAGEEQNWLVSLNNKVWGFSERTKGSWNKIQPDELVAFYVTAPTKKIIGFGRVKEKFIDKSILWGDEHFFGRPMWPYRISLELLYVVKDWDEKGISLPVDFLIQVSRKVITKDFFHDLIRQAERKWKVKIPLKKGFM